MFRVFTQFFDDTPPEPSVRIKPEIFLKKSKKSYDNGQIEEAISYQSTAIRLERDTAQIHNYITTLFSYVEGKDPEIIASAIQVARDHKDEVNLIQAAQADLFNTILRTKDTEKRQMLLSAALNPSTEIGKAMQGFSQARITKSLEMISSGPELPKSQPSTNITPQTLFQPTSSITFAKSEDYLKSRGDGNEKVFNAVLIK